MAKNKLILENSSLFWNSKRRYKVNAVVSHLGVDWQNLTGINSEPGVGLDWQKTSEFGQYFLGKYTSLVALETAHPTAFDGAYAIIDAGIGTNAIEYLWDEEEGWVQGGGSDEVTTDDVVNNSDVEGVTNTDALNTLNTGKQNDLGYTSNELIGNSFVGYNELDDPETSANTEARIVRMPNNNILMVYQKHTSFNHTGNDGYLAGKISSDEGVTWGAEFTVFNDSYDDRNHILGVLPNNNIVVVFRRYDDVNSDNIDYGYVISSNNGTTWGSYNIIESSATISMSQPFGTIIKRGSDVYFVVHVTDSGVNTFRLYKSTNNMTSTTFTNMIGTISNNAVEPFLIDIAGGKSIMLARNNDLTTAGQASFYQYNSADGVNFTYKGTTNLWNDKNFSMGTPVSMYWNSVSDDLTVVTTERKNPNTIQPEQVYNTLRVYTQKAEAVYLSQTTYSLKHNIPRPKASDYRFYGYPSVISSGTGLISVVTDASAYDRISNVSEDADTFFFRLDTQSTIKELINKSILDSKVVVNNGYTGLKDYLDYNTISKTSALKDKQDVIIDPLTGSGTSGRVSFWGGTKELTSDSNFVWDNVNKRLGVGGAPVRTLDINGIIRVTAAGNPRYELTSTIVDADNRNWDIISNLTAFGDLDIRRSASTNTDPSISVFRIKGTTGVVNIPNLAGTGNALLQTNPSGDVSRGSALPLKYVALVTQTGTSAPTVTVLENTIGTPATWSYSSVANYKLTIPDAFTVGKTFLTITSNGNFTSSGYSPNNDDVFLITGSANSLANNLFFKIEVYP